MATATQRRAAPYKPRQAYAEPEMPPIDRGPGRAAAAAAAAYTLPDHQRPIAQMGYEGARHLVPERLPSARRQRTVGFRVIDLNRSIVASIQSVAASLRRLDLSNLRLRLVDPDMIGGLLRLERIVLNHNRISESGFPENLGQLEGLVELSAHDNELTELPAVVRKLKGLHRLKLSENRLVRLDGIERLKKLQILILDDNKLQLLPKELFASLKRLEYLHCARNALTSLPSDVRHLRVLKDLNISQNELVSLPVEVFLLPHIEVINASGNRINRLPTLNVKGNLKRKLTAIDLSDNLLIRFPSHLMFMTNKLDLCQNRIRTIPLSLIDKLDQVPDLRLLLEDNPMTLPPQDVCDCGLRSIVQYFMEIKTVMRIYQGLKVLVVGDAGQGKTSLIQTMADQQARPTDDDRTSGIDVYEHSVSLEQDDDPLGRRLDLSLWDFSGNPRYMFAHQYFLQPNCLALLVFNMAEYTEAKFRSCFGAWIDWIVFRMNKIVAIPVGTHADRLKPGRAKEIGDAVIRQINKYIGDIRQSAEKEIKRIDSKAYISAALSEQLEMYRNLIRMEAFVADRVVPVSSTEFTGFAELEEAIVRMADNKEVFPNVLRDIPSLWAEVVNFIDDKGYGMQIPILPWDDYVALVTGKFGMRHLIQAITEFMHDTGKVLWFGDHPTLRGFVFLRPSWLTDVFKALFRHDIDQLDYALDDGFRSPEVGQARLERMAKEAAEEATFDREFVKFLWSGVMQTDLNRPVLEVLSLLLDHFEIGYAATGRPSRNASALTNAASKGNVADRQLFHDALDVLPTTTPTPASRKGSLRPADKYEPTSPDGAKLKPTATTTDGRQQNAPPRIGKIVIPCLLKAEQPAKFKDEYQAFSANASVAAVFRFPKYIPPGLFDRLTIRALRSEYGLRRLYHWKTGLYARQADSAVRLYVQRIDHDDGSTCISVEVRHESPASDDQVSKQVEQLWQLLLPFLKDCEEIISKYAGARMERYMECPYCRGLTFLGEWLTPKELQSVDRKTCENCEKTVSTAFLVQPKEKKRVEEFLLKRLLEVAEKRRQAAEEATTNMTSPTATAETGDVTKPGTTSTVVPDISLSLTSDNSGRKKASPKGGEKKRNTNGDRPRSNNSTNDKGTIRKSAQHGEKSSANRLRTRNSKMAENAVEEGHIMMTLMENNRE